MHSLSVLSFNLLNDKNPIDFIFIQNLVIKNNQNNI